MVATVAELRRDVVTGRFVLLAPGRAARPHTVAADRVDASTSRDQCPFCPGHESMTPPEIARTGEGAPGTPGWRVRVFPNLYPFTGGPDAGPGATGAHEVVVLSPDHERSFGALGGDEPFEVMQMLQDRARALTADGHAYVQLLVNQGRGAGASIAHPHAQVVALDFVPPAVETALSRFVEGDAVVEDSLDAAKHGLGLVDDRVVRAWCPRGSVSPYEARMAVVRGESRFVHTPDDELRHVADTLRDVLARIGAALGDPPYNVVIHDAPTTGDAPYHWWIEVVPRTSVVAGFEMGTGLLVNTVAPETAATTLSEADAR
jgi:UDPglucose--hexose-1-phosphate uridylyltransferase